MTVNEAIEKVNTLKDNAYSEATIKGFIEDCDHRVYREIIETHEGNDIDYNERYPLKGDTELFAEPGYDDFYIFYAICQIDVFNGEYDRYQNNLIMFNSKFEDFASYYNRTHLPIGKKYITTY